MTGGVLAQFVEDFFPRENADGFIWNVGMLEFGSTVFNEVLNVLCNSFQQRTSGDSG